MSRSKVVALGVAIVAAACVGTSPTRAQCRLCDRPTTLAPSLSGNSDVRLEVETRIDFDRLILAGDGGGSASIRPDGSTSTEGAIAGISGRAMVGSAVIRGEPGRAIRVEMPQSVQLYSMNGARITFDEIVTDLAALPRLDSAGQLNFRFGGRLRVEGDAEGDFRGDLPITVEYL
jgi:hypothetical protein